MANQNENRGKIVHRLGRLVFALGIVVIIALGHYYRALPAFVTGFPAHDPNILLTSPDADSVVGFGGPTPAKIYLDPDTGTIKAIEFLPNAEDYYYWSNVEKSGIFDKYLGKTPIEAAALPIDAVSGATISSNAAQQTLLTRLRFESGRTENATAAAPVRDSAAATIHWEDILVVAVLAANIFLFASKRRVKFWLSILNVGVLGFLAYSYLSFAIIAGWINTAPNWRLSIPFILFLVVIVVALIRGRNIYCSSICPYGCAQDLATRLGGRLGVSVWKVKFRHGPLIRRVVLNASILALACGLAYRLPEPFSLFQMTGSIPTLAAGMLFIIAAAVMPRLWCRWFCPCGALVDFFAKNDKTVPKPEKQNAFRTLDDAVPVVDSGACPVSPATGDLHRNARAAGKPRQSGRAANGPGYRRRIFHE